MDKNIALYTIIEGLHKNPNESWETYQNRFEIFKLMENENQNKIPKWASKRANIIFLKEKRKKTKIDRITNEDKIRESEKFIDNEEKIKKERKYRWKKNIQIEEEENKEIENAIKELYNDIITLDESHNFLQNIFEDNKKKIIKYTTKTENEENKENIKPENNNQKKSNYNYTSNNRQKTK